MGSRSPTSVMTQRLWSASISRSRRKTPGIFMASTMASTLAASRPSEKLGTHSTRVLGIRGKDKGRQVRSQPGLVGAESIDSWGSDSLRCGDHSVFDFAFQVEGHVSKQIQAA